MAERKTVNGSRPWSGMKRPGAGSTDAGYDQGWKRKPWHGPVVELHIRRSTEELETLLAERLKMYRENPPIGYPDRLPPRQHSLWVVEMAAKGSCDRCGDIAARSVDCYLGCSHWQCEQCAKQTEQEANGFTSIVIVEVNERGEVKWPSGE